MATLSLGSAEICRDFGNNFDEKQLKNSSRSDLYEFAEDLQDPALHDPSSWWSKRFCQRPIDRSTTSVDNPFKVFTDVHPLLLSYPIAMLCDAVEYETFEIIDRYLPRIFEQDGVSDISEYILHFKKPSQGPPKKKGKSTKPTGQEEQTEGSDNGTKKKDGTEEQTKKERKGCDSDVRDDFWEDDLEDADLGTKRDFKGKGEVKTDGDLVFVKDRGHPRQKRHLESYKKTAKGWKAHAEHDPVSGEILEGSLEKFARNPRFVKRR